MALKKRKAPKPESEQLYMLEILVDGLELCSVRGDDSGDRDLAIRVNFIDLAPFDIVAEGFVKAGDARRSKEARLPDRRTGREPGKTCVFVRKPSDLIRSMKSTPLSAEVYRISSLRDSRNARASDEQTLLCAATAFLPGCFCDQVAAARDKMDGLPSPYVVRRIYTLSDEHGSPCGFVSIYLRLSCFGSSIADHFALREKSFVFDGFPLSQDPRCTGPASDGSATATGDERNGTKCDSDALNEILSSARSRLPDRDTCTDASTALTRPKSPPCVSMEQPGFERLTSAEKLNDRAYRGLIYGTYPDEPTCSCLPTDRSTHPLTCRSGCTRPCCSTLRNPAILKDNNSDVSPLPTYCVDDPKSAAAKRDANRCDATRMKGGGDTEEDHRPSTCEVLWSNDLKCRLTGGSECACAPSKAATTAVVYRNEVDASKQCQPRPRTADATMAGCTCPGKDQSQGKDQWRTGTTKCTKKPCVSASCLIRAFKEAQDFVDNLGRTPGLVGLGLMDPSESPYFGRDLDRDYVQEPLSERKQGYPATAPAIPGLQCTAPCNTQIGKLGYSNAAGPFAAAATPGRTGIVREAIPTLPEATLAAIKTKRKEERKEEKKEEKAEKQKELDATNAVPADVDIGPCGEPKCKSRRKVPGQAQEAESPEAVEEAQKKAATRSKPPSVAKGRIGERVRHSKSKPGAGGDRDTGRGPVKASKRVMRYIYSLGDVYPGIHYGHKTCVDPRMRVPANMGWLWNTSDTACKLKPRIGWKPGAIGRYLYELLKEAKAGSLASMASRTIARRGKVTKTTSYASVKKLQTKREDEEEAEPPPTLHIHRKDGTYYVTMYPIKEQTADIAQLEEPTKPLQFKIAKSRDDASVASSSTASDMEIEFSPPAAVSRYRKRPNVVHVDTQVRQQEILDAFKATEAPKKKDKKEKKEKEKKEKKEKKKVVIS